MSEKQNDKQNNNFKIEDVIDRITDKNKKKIYSFLRSENKFFEDKNIDIKVQKVFWQKDKKTKEDRYSNNSYAFQIKDNEGNIIDNKKISNRVYFNSIYEKLTKIFGIEDKKKFKEKLGEACSGSGSEQRRITILHSSSLCALLFFYNVSEENPLTLTMDSRKITITFKDVLFEFQNTVIKERKPSNVDVVLLGKDNNDNKVILFLESKFSEYFDISSQFTGLGLDYLEKYDNIYNDDNLKNINLCICRDKNGVPKIFPKTNREKYNGIEVVNRAENEEMYIEGIKQMISHYIGINNLLNGTFYIKEKKNSKKENIQDEKLKQLYRFLSDKKTDNYEEKLKDLINNDNTEIYLGEILFDFHNMNISKKEAFEEYFNNYSDKYTKLAKILNGLKDKNKLKNKIIVLPQLLTYSLFKDNKENSKYYKIEHKIEDKIKEYYRLI